MRHYIVLEPKHLILEIKERLLGSKKLLDMLEEFLGLDDGDPKSLIVIPRS
jgi:hypothetical protein